MNECQLLLKKPEETRASEANPNDQSLIPEIQSRTREVASIKYPLTFNCTVWNSCTCSHKHTHMHTHKKHQNAINRYLVNRNRQWPLWTLLEIIWRLPLYFITSFGHQSVVKIFEIECRFSFQTSWPQFPCPPLLPANWNLPNWGWHWAVLWQCRYRTSIEEFYSGHHKACIAFREAESQSLALVESECNFSKQFSCLLCTLVLDKEQWVGFRMWLEIWVREKVLRNLSF